jgi:hypothetical protein
MNGCKFIFEWIFKARFWDESWEFDCFEILLHWKDFIGIIKCLSRHRLNGLLRVIKYFPFKKDKIPFFVLNTHKNYIYNSRFQFTVSSDSSYADKVPPKRETRSTLHQRINFPTGKKSINNLHSNTKFTWHILSMKFVNHQKYKIILSTSSIKLIIRVT